MKLRLVLDRDRETSTRNRIPWIGIPSTDALRVSENLRIIMEKPKRDWKRARLTLAWVFLIAGLVYVNWLAPGWFKRNDNELNPSALSTQQSEAHHKSLKWFLPRTHSHILVSLSLLLTCRNLPQPSFLSRDNSYLYVIPIISLSNLLSTSYRGY